MLPPVEKFPVLVMQWSQKALDMSTEIVPHVKALLESNRIVIIPSSRDVLLLTSTQQALEEQAEKSHFKKPRKIFAEEVIMDSFSAAHRSQFVIRGDPDRDSEGVFTAHERSHLVYEILDEIVIPKNSDLARLVNRISSNSNERSMSLRYALQYNGLVHTLTPLHEEQTKVKLYKKIMFPVTKISCPVDDIHDYYGPQIAFYFSFLEFLAKWLAVLGMLGLVTFAQRVYRGDDIDSDEYTPFYGLATFIWSVLMIRFWDQQEHEKAYRWGTLRVTNWVDGMESGYSDEEDVSHRRPEFRGMLRMSPVTGLPETHYPKFRRQLHYIVSALVTVAMLSVAFGVMILSLNLQGYIISKNRYHPFYFPYLAELAEEGHIFHSKNWMCYVPVLCHIACIITMNKIYSKVAVKLTDWENHEMPIDYENSLILKRFLFEAFDCYIVLFYLAFYECDVYQLRSELVALFNVDSFRRMATEVLVPYVMHMRDVEHAGHPNDLHLDKHDLFDDYIEIIIQLGYVILFASAYPMASLVMCLAVMVERRSDCYKLTFLCQKPIAEQVATIGMWKRVLTCMVWFSCLTNCLLFGFTSDQMMQYLPDLYYQTSDGETHLVQDRGWMVVFIVFGVERILVYLGLGMHAMIPPVGENLMNTLRRRQFLVSVAPKKTQ